MAITIGRMAKATGTKIETIRYYERIGLLRAPSRTGGNYRSYGEEELVRLSFIRRSRDLGFSIDQIRELLSFQMTGSATALAWMRSRGRIWWQWNANLQISGAFALS